MYSGNTPAANAGGARTQATAIAPICIFVNLKTQPPKGQAVGGYPNYQTKPTARLCGPQATWWSASASWTR
jgi:hypothetical protein